MESMRAVQCVEWGGPEKLLVRDVPIPLPGPGQVRIRVSAAGVNFPDALVVQRKYQVQPPLPFIPGTEVAGTVDALGEGVAAHRTGDRVVAFVGVGAFAQWVCAPAESVVAVPPGVSDSMAAAFTLTYATAYHALIDRAQTHAGETLLVLGAGGGVGLAAVEIGHALGARVIAAASSTDKLVAAQLHGASSTIDYSSADLREAVRAITDGRGVDIVFDPIGGAMTENALRLLNWRGRILIVGFAAGEIPSLPANLLLLKGTSAVGVFWSEFAKREPDANRAMLAQLFAWLSQGRLRPHVTRTATLEDVPEVLGDLLARRVVGKVVVKP